MDTREAYKDRYKAQLDEWSAKVDVLKAQAEKATAQAKIDLAPHVDGVHHKLEAVKAKLAQMAQATDDKWTDFKTDADKVWQDFEHSVAGAFDAIKPHADKPEPKKPADLAKN